MIAEDELYYRIALTLIPGVGDITAKKLIAYCGGVAAIFTQKKAQLLTIPDVGPVLAKAIKEQNVLKRAEEEVNFISKNGITPIFYLDSNYPKRLKDCEDGPVMLYTQGDINFDNQRVLSIIGTRKNTDYGKKITEQVVEQLAPLGCLIVSGLAYGIDTISHREALKNNLPTLGVVAHGLDMVYPAQNRNMLEKMKANGGWCTDFISGTIPDRMNFPRRNRIIAGLADATLVIEAAEKSGTLITADLAHGYNRDVFAVPGNIGQEFSAGCNKLIRENKAALVTGAEDLVTMLGWQTDAKHAKNIQRSLFVELNPDEQLLVDVLKANGLTPIDEIGFKSGLPPSKCSSLLFTLEFKGVVRALPGKVYELV